MRARDIRAIFLYRFGTMTNVCTIMLLASERESL